MMSPLPGAWPEKPGSATLPFFGVVPLIVDDKARLWALAACAASLVNHPCFSLPSCPRQCMQGACLCHLLQPVLHGHRGLDTAQQVPPARWSAPGSLGVWSSEPGLISISDRSVLRKQGWASVQKGSS